MDSCYQLKKKNIFVLPAVLKKLVLIESGHYRHNYSTHHVLRKGALVTSQYLRFSPTNENRKPEVLQERQACDH